MCSHMEKKGGKILDIFICPHRPEDNCLCRKPLPGLIESARRKYSFDPEQTWFIGDSKRDIEAAQAAGCIPGLVLTGRGKEYVSTFEATINIFHDLNDFSKQLS